MKKIIVFPFVVFLLLLFIDIVFTYSIKNNDYNKIWWEWSIKSKTFDYLILGHSRPLTGFNTFVLDSILNKSGLNLSLDDSKISSQYLILKYFLTENNNSTKYLILNIDPWLLNEDSKEEDRVWCFLPYIDSNLVFDHFKKFYPTRAFFWRYFPAFQYIDYNSEIGPFTALNYYFEIINKPFNEKGDRLKQGTFLSKKNYTKITKLKNISKDAEEVKYLERIFRLAEKNNIKVYTVTLPVYGDEKEDTDFYFDNFINNHCLWKKYDVAHKSFLTCYDVTEYFYDNTHLNSNGAIEFTKRFSTYFEQKIINSH